MAKNKQTQTSTVTVTTPPATGAELDAQNISTYLKQLDLWNQGFESYRDDQGILSFRPRSMTADEEKQYAQNKEIEDLTMRKLKGEITPQEQALIDQTYGSAIETGKSDIRSEFGRALEQLQLGEGRGYQDIQTELQRGTEDINKFSRQDAAERGLSQGSTPIYGERADKFQRFGEDINRTSSRLFEDVGRNKRLLGEDLTRNVSDLETSMLGQKSAATMDVMKSGQLFAQASREFQAGLQQQSYLNRQMMGESFSNTAANLGNLRSRNYTQNSTSTMTGGGGGGGGNTGSIMGGAGGFMQGISSLMGSSGGSSIGTMGSSIYSGIGSSKDFKDDIEAVDLDQILHELESTPVYTWRYKPLFKDPRQHIGPVVEESPGRIVDGKVLVNQDMLGFLFATVKALHEKIKQLESA